MRADMKVYLMRHGDAVASHRWRGSDETRPLSDIGLTDVHSAAQHIEYSDLKPATVFTSPLTRAWETAKIFQSMIDNTTLVVENSIAAGAKSDAFKKLLMTSKEKHPYLIVAHNPDLSLLACRITGIPRLIDDLSIEKGEILYLETGDLEQGWGNGSLIWRRDLSEWSKFKIS
jgi:phosphohistidine phosphatase SixA